MPNNSQGGGNQYNSDPQELESKSILIQNKRFYLDVKENNRGRFLKIAEVTPGGHKNRVTMSMQLLPEFRDLLSDFVDHYARLGPSTAEGQDDDNANRRPLKTAKIVKGQRRYFMDLKENVRGRYLRVRAPGQSNDMPQQVIVLPASGMIEFRDTITGLIEQFHVEEAVEEEELNHHEENLPQSTSFGSRRSKTFYLDIGKNPRGIYVRMTEQSASYRQSITIPDRHFREIGEWFLNAASHLEENGLMDKEELDNKRGKGSRPSGGNKNKSGNRRRSRDDDEYSEE